jgi:predicted nucleic acid-binding protein
VKALLDSSVLIAALVEGHARHGNAFPWLRSIRSDTVEGLIAAHSIAETYAVLSSLPISPRITPAAAWALVEHSVLPFVQSIELTTDEVRGVMRRLSRMGLADGVVYDALIAEAAGKAGADCLITLNPSGFRRVLSAGVMEVREP